MLESEKKTISFLTARHKIKNSHYDVSEERESVPGPRQTWYEEYCIVPGVKAAMPAPSQKLAVYARWHATVENLEFSRVLG